MFLRTKKVKGNDYCYLVENKAVKGKVKQKTKKYLGRVFWLEKKEERSFMEYMGILELGPYLEKSLEKVLGDLMEWELFKVNFDVEGLKFDKKKLKIMKGKQEVVLGVNEGFMCNFTVKRILGFEPTGDLDKDAGRLAKLFVEAGFDLEKEVFIGIYQEFFADIQEEV